MEGKKIEIKPDNPYLHVFLLLLLFALLQSGSLFYLILFSILYVWLRSKGKFYIDDFYVTANEKLLSSRKMILPRGNIRVIRAQRTFGNALILNDRTSIQEIILYEWLYSRKTLKFIQGLFQG